MTANAPLPNLMTPEQLKYLRRLAHQVTGDGDSHVAAFQARHGQAVTTAVASAEINALKGQLAPAPKAPGPGRIRPLVQTPDGYATTNAPAGRYAVRFPGVDAYRLFEVTKPTDGQWAGRTFVKTMSNLEGAVQEPVKGAEAVQVLNLIEEDPRIAASFYGRITGRCGFCHRQLRDRQLQLLGIGPECIMKLSYLPPLDFE